MVLGHLTVTASARRILGRRLPWVGSLSPWLLVLGCYLPDILDKPLNHLLGLSGRGYGHSLVVQCLLFAAAAALFPLRRRGVLALSLGAAIHLLQDWVDPTTLFAPLRGPIPGAPPWGLLESLVGFYARGGPPVWIEVAALCHWAVVGWRAFGPARSPRPRRRLAVGETA